MSILKYPLELNENNLDYISFNSYKYRTNKTYVNSEVSGASGPAVGNTVHLFMPVSTPPMSNGNNWSEDFGQGPLGQLQRSMGIATTSAIMSAGDGGIQGTIDSVVSKFAAEFGAAKAGGIGGPAKQAALNFISPYAGRSANQLLALSKGQIYNPNIELLYQAPGIRSYSFSYLFAPKSAKEAEIVNNIILEFKKWSSPLETGGMFEIPPVWQVTYMTGGAKNKNMNAFKRSALTNVSVQANPSLDMHMSYAQGVPITTAMTLEFMEVDIITRRDHEVSGTNQGY